MYHGILRPRWAAGGDFLCALFGDEVLIGFSGFLQSFFRKEDILIRTGGDEFVVFLKEISREALEKKVSELVKNRIRSLDWFTGTTITRIRKSMKK